MNAQELAEIRAAGARLAENAPPLSDELLALVVRLVGPVPRAAVAVSKAIPADAGAETAA